jgi:uncharacterized protein YecT (DUF1311 family)
LERINPSAAVVLSLVLIGLWTDAQAQSFDCREAKSSVEKLICRDKGLRKLDSDLDRAFRTAMDDSDSRTVMRDQRQWLRLRNGAHDPATLERLYSDRIRALQALPIAKLVTDQNNDLGVAITLPSNRSIRPCDREQRCIEVHGSRSGFMGMLLRLQAVEKPLEKAARDEAGFT